MVRNGIPVNNGKIIIMSQRQIFPSHYMADTDNKCGCIFCYIGSSLQSSRV